MSSLSSRELDHRTFFASLCIRNPIIDTIVSEGSGVHSPINSPISFMQLDLDHIALTCDIKASGIEELQSIEFICKRLCQYYIVRDTNWYLVPRRQRKKEMLKSYLEAIRSTQKRFVVQIKNSFT